MLNLFPQRVTNCEIRSRRDFMLRVGTLGALGISLDQLLRLEASAAPQIRDSQRSCILIWTRGGTSHHDTLDPKPEAEAQIRGEFGVVDTSVPGVQFSDQVPGFAKHFDKFSVVRNLNSLNGAHQVADAIMMSGRKINPTVKYPCYGSVIARERGHRNNMPAFVQLGNDVDRKFFGGTAGYLGVAHNPFEIHGDPNEEKVHGQRSHTARRSELRSYQPAPGGIANDRHVPAPIGKAAARASARWMTTIVSRFA